jgi:hypothetical protein
MSQSLNYKDLPIVQRAFQLVQAVDDDECLRMLSSMISRLRATRDSTIREAAAEYGMKIPSFNP